MRDSELIKAFNRRTVLLAGGKFILFSVLIGRMTYLQIIAADKYKKLSDQNSTRIKFIPPQRGKIYDKNNIILADNTDNYTIELIAEETLKKQKIDDVLSALEAMIELTDLEKERIKKEIKRKKSFLPILIKDNLSWDKMAQIQAKNLDFPGVYIEKGEIRTYPKNEIAAHAIGYVGRVAKEDLENNKDPLLELPNFRIGKTGAEKYYDLYLRGKRGEIVKIVDSTGRTIDVLESKNKKPIIGKDLTLTIDYRLQEYAYNIIKEDSASATIMDIYTGDILLMTSTPSYDPNIFNTKQISEEEFAALEKDEKKPFINKAITGLYAPGSTFKMMSALAGLQSGEITPSTKVYCTGKMFYADTWYHCWKKEGHGSIDLVSSLKHSCDIYYYEVGLKAGIDKIKEIAHKFGLDEPTGIDLPNEKIGQVPGKEWKRKHTGQTWFHGDTISAVIGQGYTITTPIALAVMTARIANGGFAVKPRIVKDIKEISQIPISTVPSEILFPKIEGIDPYYLDLIKKGMYAVVNAKEGTGKSAAISYKGQRMSGKTGTTQVRRISMEERATGIVNQMALPWKYRNHALFVGFAPSTNPRYAISVVVEHGRGGAAAAAPIARDLMLKTLQLYT